MLGPTAELDAVTGGEIANAVNSYVTNIKVSGKPEQAALNYIIGPKLAASFLNLHIVSIGIILLKLLKHLKYALFPRSPDSKYKMSQSKA